MLVDAVIFLFGLCWAILIVACGALIITRIARR